MDLVSATALAKRTDEQEREFNDLKAVVEKTERTADALAADKSAGDLESLAAANARLNFRKIHLQEALRIRESKSADAIYTTQKRLEALFHVAVVTVYPMIEEFVNIVNTCDPRHGDYQCNTAMQLCQWLKKQGKSEKAVDIAALLVAALPPNDLIESTKINPIGFVNVFLRNDYVTERLTTLLRKNVPPPTIPKKFKVIVDYSSPNIAKEMHVGHLRSTIIGDSIANLLEFVGHDVLRLSHIGDWGTQFGMLIAHLQDKFPNYLSVSPPIGDLQSFYREAKVRFDDPNEPEFKKRAYNCVVELQSRNPDSIKAWTMIVDVSDRENKQVYKRLKISDKLQNRGESFYDEMMKDVVKQLDEGGHLKLEDGRKLMFVPDCPIPMTVVKSDGGFTYDTSDMATIRHRLQVEKCDWNIYVIDSGQKGHIDMVIKAAEVVGWYNPSEQKNQFVGFGLVLGEDSKKFKTRSGTTIRLSELLDEGLTRSAAKLQEKNRDKDLSKEEFEAARDAVAYGCIKYADLSKNRISDYIFSFDKMLEDRGNTAVYLLYAYTRIRAITRNSGVSAESLQEYLQATPRLPLDHPKEFKLAKKLIQFHEVILSVLESLLMNGLCDYVYELSCVFTEFYDVCYCIEKDRKTGEIVRIHKHRLLLCEATSAVMDRCFKILGITPVSKM
ncbi:Arginine--tRNA ligase, cytoplasmic [Hypsibius exemplaris]|uniref:Probable arginine--tRNA ligase, cytoplasmic n=1 Tax=Hypsibius exemplaris TaxID=2072580 RepID=A0A9X6RLP9_HYPEX|nr:Arginine--tRNA ligase, cytoplasmic [Hypsibius exemplaris]